MSHTRLLDLEVIDTLEGLSSIREEWSGLSERSLSATPFQGPEWVIPFWRYFNCGQLHTLVFRSSGRLAGLVPLYIEEQTDSGRRTVRLAGTGPSDYLDMIAEPDLAAQCASLFYSYLSQNRAMWDICDLQELQRSSALLSVRIPVELNLIESRSSVCPVLRLSTCEEFHRGLARGFRIRMKRAAKALEKAGPVRVEEAQKETLPEFLETLFVLHGARWKLLNQTGVLNGDRVREFHREAASGLLDEDKLWLMRLKFEERDAAVIYAFISKKRVYSYLGGFDPALEGFSPGRVLMGHAIEEAIRRGFREFDFLRGAEHYKYVWGAKDSVNSRLVLNA